MKILKWFFLGPVLLLIVVFSGCELNKAYWDYQVTKMCKKDGGVTVYEKVDISKKEHPKLFNIMGTLVLPYEKNKSESPYFYRYKNSLVRKGYLSISRGVTLIVSSKENKVVGQQVDYLRSGGDFPTIISFPSSFSCKEIQDNLNYSLAQS
jgi:hypothetical protein